MVRNIDTDTLWRAKAAFKGLSETELNTEYGQSGRTKRQIIEGYQTNIREAEELVVFFDEVVK